MTEKQEKIKLTDNIIEKTKNTILGFIDGYSSIDNAGAAEAVEHLSKALHYMQLVKEREETE